MPIKRPAQTHHFWGALASLPVLADGPEVGDMVYDTTAGAMKVCTGTSPVAWDYIDPGFATVFGGNTIQNNTTDNLIAGTTGGARGPWLVDTEGLVTYVGASDVTVYCQATYMLGANGFASGVMLGNIHLYVGGVQVSSLAIPSPASLVGNLTYSTRAVVRASVSTNDTLQWKIGNPNTGGSDDYIVSNAFGRFEVITDTV